tara:strand:- start:416 stop:589 length:174 start_codon:yes stop_codon:yes gene_type:complete
MSFDLRAEVMRADWEDFKQKRIEEILAIAEGMMRSEPEMMSADDYEQLKEFLDELGI